MVAKYDSTYGYLFDGISTNNRNALYGGSTHRLYCGGTEPLYSGGTAWKIFSPVFNGNSTRHYVNGNVGGTTGTGTQNLIGLSLGSRYTASEFFIGKIAEVIVISGEDNNESRQLAEGYLAHKWGLEGSLPTGHPYKDFPPTK